MSTNAATLVIDADTLRFISQMNKAKQSLKDLGDHGHGAMEKLSHGMTRALIHAAGFATIGRTISQAAKDVEKMEAKLGKESGGRSMNLANAALSLGVKDVNGFVGSVGRQRGGTTMEEQDAFALALAQHGRAGKKPGGRHHYSDKDILGLTGAYSMYGSYAFGENGEDLLNELGKPKWRTNPMGAVGATLKGRFGTTDKDKIYGGAPRSVKEEWHARKLERLSHLDLLDTASGEEGTTARATADTKEQMKLRNPALMELTNLGGEAAGILGFGGVVEKAGSGWAAVRHLEAIKEAVEGSAKHAVRPNLGAGQEHKP